VEVSVQVEDNTAIIASPDNAGVPQHHQSTSPPRRKRGRKRLDDRVAGKDNGVPPAPFTTVTQIIKTVEAATPPQPRGQAKHKRPPSRAPPSLLFLRFSDLQKAGLVNNHHQLVGGASRPSKPPRKPRTGLSCVHG
jgi:hypothetical protein